MKCHSKGPHVQYQYLFLSSAAIRASITGLSLAFHSSADPFTFIWYIMTALCFRVARIILYMRDMYENSLSLQ